MLLRAGVGLVRSIGRVLRRLMHRLGVLARLGALGALVTLAVVLLDAALSPDGRGRDRGRLPRP